MRPRVVAHRGASDENAEHTLLAYQRAILQGADGLECDVRLTADGHLVCVHDRNLKRTASSRGLVSTMDLDELSAYDFGSWKKPWADLDDEAEETDRNLLTLRTLLQAVADADRRVELAIETKHPTRYSGLVERRLAEMLAEFGWAGADSPVRVMSFSVLALQRMAKLAPGLRLVMLMDKTHQWSLVQGRLGRDWILAPGIELLKENPKHARRLAGTGRELHVWTVNTAYDLDLCERLGVTTVITDKPAFILGLLDR